MVEADKTQNQAPPKRAGPGRPKAPQGRITDRLSNGAVWITAARVFMVAALLAQTVLLARLLSPEMFGLAAIATTIAAVIEIATKQSLTAALVQLPKVTDDHLNTAFTLNLIRGAIIGLTIFALAYPVAAIYEDDRVAPLLLALGASTSLFGISNPKLYIFTKELVFWQELARTIAERAAATIVSVAVAYYFRTHWAIIAGVAAGQLSLVVSSFFFVAYRPRISLKCWRDLMSFSVWVTLSQFQQAVMRRMDQILVGFVLGNASLGILTVANRLAEAPTKETSAPLLKTAFPGFAKLVGEKDKLAPAYQRIQSLTFLICFPMACGLMMVAEPTVMLFLGPNWEEAIIVVQLLAGAFGLQTMASPVNPLAMAMGETKALFLRTLFNTVLKTIMVVGGLMLGGLVGLLLARFFHSFTSAFVNMGLVKRFLDLSYLTQLAVNARTMMATGAMVLALVGYDHFVGSGTTEYAMAIELAAKVSLGGAVFACVIGALWAITKRPGPEDEFIKIARSMIGRYISKMRPTKITDA